MQPWSPSGLQIVPHLRWGSHVAHFYGSGDDLRDVLVPYFKAGLENNERCLWVTGDAFNAEQARAALRAALPDLDKRERIKQIEIANGDEWYAAGEKLRPRELLNGLLEREQDAVGLGYAGLRTNGNCSWVSRDQWADFLEYETLVQQTVRGRRMICMCSYCMDELLDGANVEVMERHDMTMPRALRSPSRGSSDAPAAAFDACQERAAEHASRHGRERRDLPSGREALDHHISSMARAHDLLMQRAGTGASLRDVVMCALDAFSSSQVKMSGSDIDVSPKHVLALSVALHELATNAAKYGALSSPQGRVDVKWAVKGGILHMDWEESGGPPVSPPTQIRFGARLLVEILSRYLDGHVTLNYAVSGVRSSITATL